MAFNPGPEIAAAREVARKFDADQVIVVIVARDQEYVQTASYGRTRALCDHAKPLGDAVQTAVMGLLGRA